MAQFFVEKLVPNLVISSDEYFETPKTLSDRSNTIWTSHENVFNVEKMVSKTHFFALQQVSEEECLQVSYIHTKITTYINPLV